MPVIRRPGSPLPVLSTPSSSPETPTAGADPGVDAPRPSSPGWGPSPLARIANAKLASGPEHSCVATVRTSLARLGFKGLPEATGSDPNNPRGMMVQMLKSGAWENPSLPGSTQQGIKSPYGTVTANVFSRDEYVKAVASGTIPQGAVLFQTEHGWAYGGGARGNDVSILQGDHVHNYADMNGLLVYGAKTRDVVVLLPAG